MNGAVITGASAGDHTVGNSFLGPKRKAEGAVPSQDRGAHIF